LQQVANLLVFPESANYVVVKNSVKEDVDYSTFQHLGTLSLEALSECLPREMKGLWVRVAIAEPGCPSAALTDDK
jgi:hypothetical protein